MNPDLSAQLVARHDASLAPPCPESESQTVEGQLSAIAGLAHAAPPGGQAAILQGLMAALGQVVLAMVQHGPDPASDRGEQLLGMEAAAEVLGVPVDHARDLGRRGELPVVKVGKYVRVRRSSLDAWIRKREENRGDLLPAGPQRRRAPR